LNLHVNNISFYIVVVSDRVYSGLAIDESGELASKIIVDKGYVVRGKTVIPNNPREIVKILRSVMDVDVILFIGGTGLSPRDITIDSLEAFAWRKIPGFGELFRLKSFETIGYRGLLSRAEAYVLVDGRIVVGIPGSVDAVKLALEILLGLIDHALKEIRRFEHEHVL